MKRHRSNQSWIQAHLADPYVQRSQKDGYRSRAAYKLLEIDERDRLLAPGQLVVDLGAAPGSWTQVIVRKVGPKGVVAALDILDMEPLEGATVLKGDFREQPVLDELEALLAGRPVDLVVSDMAPNLSGVAASDAARSIHLCELALDFALDHLKPGGAFLVKTFQGTDYPAFLKAMKAAFRQVNSRKPDASRERSAEMYLLAREPRPR